MNNELHSPPPRARFLAVGNFSSKSIWDIRFLLSQPDVEALNTGPGKNLYRPSQRAFREIVSDARSGAYELVLAGNNAFPYFNPRKYWIQNLANLTRKLISRPNLLTGGRFPYSKMGCSLVGIDMEDRPVVDNRWFGIWEHCVCFFKRELPLNPCNTLLYTSSKTEDNGNILHSAKYQRWLKKLRPISLGVAPDLCQQYADYMPPKKTDVFFAGDLKNRPNRQAGIRQLEQLRREGFAIDIAEEKLQREEFLHRCAQAYLVWSPEGFGWDCFRHYEISLLGSVPLLMSPSIHRYAPLMNNEHAIYYDVEANHLAGRVRAALQNRAGLAAMGQAARQHVLQWHTHDALSRYVIAETRRTLAEKAEQLL